MAKLTVDRDLVADLADLMDEKGLTEVEIKQGEQSLRLSRGATGALVAAPAHGMAAPAPAAPAATGTGGEAVPAGSVKAPMVGTVYLSPQPGAPQYITVGATVSEGQTLVIIEAMKVMNAIPAPRSGTVKAILVEDGEPVEYDQPLLVIE